MNPREYGADGESDFVSTPLLLQVQMKTVRTADVLPSAFEFTFQHNKPQDQYQSYAVANFTTVCTARNASQQFSFACPNSGHLIRHNCSQGAGTHTSYCPVPTPACARLDYLSAEITLPTSCRVIRSDALSTTCSCSVATAVGDGRRLASQTTEESILDDSGATDMMVSTVYIASNFVDTFHAADELNSPGAVSKVLVVIILLSMLWVPALLFVGFEWMRPARTKVTPQRAQSAFTVLEKVREYARTIVPAVYDSRVPLSVCLWKELMDHHTLFRLMTLTNVYKRRLAIFRTLTVLTFMLFLTAVFFDVSNPGDDGSCGSYSEESECLHRTSPFDYSRTYCSWNAQDTTCTYKAETISLTALFYLTVMTTIATSIASVPVDYCFQILEAPTQQGLKASKVADTVKAMVRGARRLSNVGASVMTGVNALRVPTGTTDAQSAQSRAGSVLARTFLLMSGKSIVAENIIAPRELSEDFEALAEAVRKELPGITANARASIALIDERRSERRPASMRRSMNAIPKAPKSGLHEAADQLAGEEEVNDDKGDFLEEVLQQRDQFSDDTSVARVFEDQWGVRKGRGPERMFSFLPSAAETLYSELESVEREAAEINDALPNYSVQHAGLEILHLFIVDLLGRNTAAAKIFKEKFGEEFADSQVVLPVQKYAAAALMIGLNAFFMYFVLLKGVQKGEAWQLQYLVCALIQMIIDVLIFETTECIWLNFFVPRSVQSEVVVAAAALTAAAEAMVDPQASTSSSSYFLNAPAHLFVSARVAKAHPQLLESLIVMSYSNHLPGQICKTWPHCESAETAREAVPSRPYTPILRGAAFTVQVCLAVPFLYQRILLRFVQPMAFSAVSVMWFSTIRSPSSMAVMGAAIGACVIFFWWQRRARRSAEQQRSVLPVTAEQEAAPSPAAAASAPGPVPVPAAVVPFAAKESVSSLSSAARSHVEVDSHRSVHSEPDRTQASVRPEQTAVAASKALSISSLDSDALQNVSTPSELSLDAECVLQEVVPKTTHGKKDDMTVKSHKSALTHPGPRLGEAHLGGSERSFGSVSSESMSDDSSVGGGTAAILRPRRLKKLLDEP
jgi:hypothetical protein